MKTMRHLLLATTAIMALSVSAMAADLGVPQSGSPLYSGEPMVQGDMSAALGGAWGSGSENQSFGAYDTSARFALPLVSGIRFEGELLDGGIFKNGESANSFLGLAHLYTQSAGYAVGIFGGAGSAFGGAGLWQAGLEGQLYWGNFTGEGTVAYSSLAEGSATLWTGRLGGRYYFTPDTKLSLGVDYLSFDSAGSSDAWGVDGAVEHRFTGTPWGAFVKAAYLDGNGGNVTTALVGLRVSLDGAGSTLQSHDRAVPWQTPLGILGFGG